MNIQYPFIKMDAPSLAIKKNTYFMGKIKKNNNIINTELDQLLLTGFEGTEEDFKNIYNRHQQKKKIKLKLKKFNRSLMINPDFNSKSIKLTKIKEFNQTYKHKYKGMKKILNNLENKRKEKENESKFDENIHRNKSGIYFGTKNASSIVLDSYNTKSNGINNINNSKEKEKYNENKMKRIIKIRKILKQKSNNILPTLNNSFQKSNKGKQNLNKDNKESSNQEQNKSKSFLSKSLISIKNSKNLTNKNTDKKIIHDINKVFKKYLGINSINEEEDQKKLKKVLDSLQTNFKSNLKEVQKYVGNSRQNIWMKKTTANLISFGTSFLLMPDDIFFKEHKRIICKYPELEKDAQILVPPEGFKENKTIKKIKKNERKIQNLCSENEVLLRGINKKWREQKLLRSQSEYFIKPKIKKLN